MGFVTATTLPQQQPVLQVAQEDAMVLDHRFEKVKQWLEGFDVFVGQLLAEPRVQNVQVLFVGALGHQYLLGEEVGLFRWPFLRDSNFILTNQFITF